MNNLILNNDTLHSCYILKYGDSLKLNITVDYNLSNHDKVLEFIFQTITRLREIY